jgi:prevent-host-death family protein
MDKIVSASEANRQFSKLLQNVRAGESYAIASHGKVVARLVPPAIQDVGDRRKAWDRWMRRLERQRPRNLGPWSREEGYE